MYHDSQTLSTRCKEGIRGKGIAQQMHHFRNMTFRLHLRHKDNATLPHTDFYPSEEWRAQYHWDDSHESERRVIEQRNGNVGSVSGYFDEYNAIVINAADGTLIDLGKGY